MMATSARSLVDNRLDDMHPFGFVDYDEDEEEQEVQPMERLAQQFPRTSTGVHVSQAAFPSQSYPSTSSESSSPHTAMHSGTHAPQVPHGNMRCFDEQGYLTMKNEGASRDCFPEGDAWNGGRGRGEDVARPMGFLPGASLPWDHRGGADRVLRPQVDPFMLGSGGKDVQGYNPQFLPPSQPMYHAPPRARDMPRHGPGMIDSAQQGLPALINFANENLELRAQIQSCSQEIMQLRAALKEQQAGGPGRSQGGNEWKSRYWTVAEHQKFLEAIQLYGKRNFKAIAAHVGTRNSTQAKTHAQKYFARLERQKKTAGSEAPQDTGCSSSTTDSPPEDQEL